MQSITTRRAISALRASPTCLRPALSQAQLIQARRTYADASTPGKDPEQSSPTASKPPAGGLSASIPFIAVGALVLGTFSIYFTSSSKEAASGQAERLETRRREGTANEYRDSRDSGVKTLQQKKEKQEREGKDNVIAEGTKGT